MLLSLFMLIVGSIADLLALALLTRFAMQWAPSLYRSPLGNFVAAVTDWAVLPARKMVPGLLGPVPPGWLPEALVRARQRVLLVLCRLGHRLPMLLRHLHQPESS